MYKQLKELEDESISIIRDTYIASSNPVVMYSIGKDSSVLLNLFLRAFYPLKVPVPFLHIDTGWKFKEMILFKEKMSEKYNLNIITFKNKQGVSDNINPFDHENYTDIMKTAALKIALDKGKYDFIYGGARRDEEPSRSKEKVLSHRNKFHVWEPLNQRIEPWHLFNFLKSKDETFRIFPLSNWTELNIWEYIKYKKVEIVDLYFAKKRKVVKRDGELFLLDDERFKLNNKDIVFEEKIRFRTLGCYPLTSGIKSEANNINKIIDEIKNANLSERSGRLIDVDKVGSMEIKKRQGYF